MPLERYPSAMDDARAACRRRESTGTRGAVAGFPVISMRLALFFVVLCLAPRAVRGQWQSPGDSCSSDSDCYQGNTCAGGVCCLESRYSDGVQNCTQCGSGHQDYQDGYCSQCAEGSEPYYSKCRQTCDSATQYRSGMYSCEAKSNAGQYCENNDRCLSGLCGQNNYCCDCDAATADGNGQCCIYCTWGNGTCAQRSSSATCPSGECLNGTIVGGSPVSGGQSPANNSSPAANKAPQP